MITLAERRIFRYIVALLYRISQRTVERTVDTAVLNIQFLCRDQLAALSEVTDDLIHQENDWYPESFCQIKGSDDFIVALLALRTEK